MLGDEPLYGLKNDVVAIAELGFCWWPDASKVKGLYVTASYLNDPVAGNLRSGIDANNNGIMRFVIAHSKKSIFCGAWDLGAP